MLSTRFAILTVLLALATGPAFALDADARPGFLLPNLSTLAAELAADAALADEIAEVAQGIGYVPTLVAYARVQAVRALKAGHPLVAARWKLIHSKLSRGKPVEVQAPQGTPWQPGEKVNFELQAEVPIIGNTKVGRAWTLTQPALLEEGKVSLHLTAEVIVERFAAQKTHQEIYVDAETLLVQRSEIIRYDGSNNETDRYVDNFDHVKHQTVRTRPTGAPATTTYAATHTLTTAAWVPYAARAQGFDVGTSWSLVMVEDAVPFALKVEKRTNIGADKVFALTSSRVNAWIFDNVRRLPRRVQMMVEMTAGDDDGFFANRKVTLEYKSVEGVSEDNSAD